MKVLISAYSCEPGRGSEPEVGLRTILLAARSHAVWVITRNNNLPTLRSFLRGRPEEPRITLVGCDLGPAALKMKMRFGFAGLQWYYDRWQRLASSVALHLDRHVDFDLIHHVTMSSYWSRVGIARLNKPLVWGPVGGGVEAPLTLYPILGLKGAVAELGRLVMRPALAFLHQSRGLAARASVTLAVNPETAARLGIGVTNVVPNATAAEVGEVRGGARRAEIAVVGRVIPLKAVTLAVRAIALVACPVPLVVFGTGPDLPRVVRLAKRLGVQDRVQFAGEVSRQEVIERIHRAALVLHPAIHEEGSLAVAEALMLGTPLVSIARGGPAVLAPLWPNTPVRLIKPTSPTRTARDLAAAIDELWKLATPVSEAPMAPIRTYGADILAAYETAAHLGSTI